MVNPAGLTTDLDLLQPVPLTFTLQVKEIQIRLLMEVADTASEGSQDFAKTKTLGAVYATCCQV